MDRTINFLICGAQKSGTSALHHYLSQHPQIFLPAIKELHLFDQESADWSDAGIANIDARISASFAPSPDQRAVGEATPVSLWWDPAMERIWRYNPQMRLIAVLRNPITRAWANWRMEQLKGRDKQPFTPCLKEELARCREALPYQHRVRSYLSRGFYSEQLRRVWRFFPVEQVLVLKQEELRDQPQQCLERVHKLLGVKTMALTQQEAVNSWRSIPDTGTVVPESSIPRTANSEITAALREVYRAEIQNLQAMLGWDCSDWLEGDSA